MPNKGQPVAEGAYITTRGEETVRRETWQLARMARGLIFTARAEQIQPQPATWNFDYTLTQNWDPAEFSIHREAEGQTLASEQRVQGARYSARITPRGGEPKEYTLEISAKHQLDFPSPLFTAVTLIRLNLQVGQTREVDAVRVVLPAFEPQIVAQKYTCAGEEPLQVPAGRFTAWRYVTSTAGDPAEAQLWADRHGIVLQYRFADGSETRLARYRRIDRR
ncbi:MAG: putative glycolipid-binding domain-containing protein [Chloroflexi bacterium]|nr:putative glycolipid-binding domain-containing protein [Chloroflexota bacterium]